MPQLSEEEAYVLGLYGKIAKGGDLTMTNIDAYQRVYGVTLSPHVVDLLFVIDRIPPQEMSGG